MLLLHLFVNNHLNDDELNTALHPSEGKTEKAQFYCYIRESEKIKDLNCPHNQGYIQSAKGQYDSVIDEMETRKKWLLQKLQRGIYNNFQRLGYPEEKCALFSNIVFKMCVKKYLKICIGKKGLEKHPVDLSDLLELSKQPG